MPTKITPWPAEMMEAYRWLDECLLEQPGAEKAFHPAWQAYQYRLRGKLYAYVGVDDRNGRPILTAKLAPEYGDLLRREFSDVVPGYYMNKLSWSTAYLDGSLPRGVLADMARASYQTLFESLSKKARREIGAQRNCQTISFTTL